MPDGHLSHLHPAEDRRHRAQPDHRRGVDRPDEDVQICVSVPVGDVDLSL